MTLPPFRRLCVLAVAGLAACKDQEPLVPAAATAEFPAGVTAQVGGVVATTPTVRVTAGNGKPVPGVAVTFAVASGGGSVMSPSQTTNSSGLASSGTWTLGPVAGENTVTAAVANLPAVTFTATGLAGPATRLALVTAPPTTAVNRAALGTQPVVHVQDANGNLVTGSTALVTAALASGGGTLGGTLSVAAAGGVATFTNLSISGTIGSRTINFFSGNLTPVVSAAINVTPGTAASIALNAGNNQSAAPGASVPTAPSVKVSDADANGVAGVTVTFAVASGDGSVAGANPQSDANGIATVGSWQLGSATGSNTLTASAAGLAGSPVTFSATATNTAITAVSPATLTSGATATITGAGFSTTPANNAVTIDGVTATVTAASATSLTVTVPTLPCTPAHNAAVSVSVSGGGPAAKNHPVQAATQHALSAGQSVTLATAATAACNELSNTSGLYYVTVYNSNSVYSTTGATFELKGTPGAASLVAADARVARSAISVPGTPRRRIASEPSTEERADRAHLEHLERNLEFLRQNGYTWRRGARRASLVAAGGRTANAVGDIVQIRLPDLRTSDICQTYLAITGRVAYVGTRSIIVEDNENPLAGTIDTTYAQLGSEFDSVMWPILETNFGNPIANDAALDNNARIVMVFTEKLSDVGDLGNLGLAGFVVGCDYFPRSTYASSNVGEHFYATAPRVAGDINVANSPPRWRWSIRGTIIHEVKHIVSTSERFFRNGGSAFEVSWLEETTARISEELYERVRYNFTQRSNIGYGSTANPVGPYCGVRLSCNQARGIIRVFEELGVRWYAAPHEYSPLGRINSSDFSFYATGWSMVRWAIDASSNSESAILKGMTQEPTRTGIANFEQASGLTFASVLPKWTVAMVVDDYPGFAPADAAIQQPSWNFRDVFASYKVDFPTATFASWPLVPLAESFGTFATTAAVRPGTAAVIQLSGTQSAKQLLELKASGSSAAAPAELRLAIVRVQ